MVTIKVPFPDCLLISNSPAGLPLSLSRCPFRSPWRFKAAFLRSILIQKPVFNFLFIQQRPGCRFCNVHVCHKRLTPILLVLFSPDHKNHLFYFSKIKISGPSLRLRTMRLNKISFGSYFIRLRRIGLWSYLLLQISTGSFRKNNNHHGLTCVYGPARLVFLSAAYGYHNAFI